MICGVLTFRAPLSSSSSFTCDSKRPAKHSARLKIECSNSSPDIPLTTEKIVNDSYLTGGAYDFDRASTSLTQKLLSSPKKVTIVRHGLSSWNKESRVQGSSNLSVLTETGVRQAERCRKALGNMYFDRCFSSPISRAKSTAEVIWQGREEPLIFLDSLKEAHLFYLEGMKNGRNIQRSTQHGEKILLILLSMASTLCESYGGRLEKLGRKYCFPLEKTFWSSHISQY